MSTSIIVVLGMLRLGGAELQHISARVQPNPEKAKDWITHSLHWKRMGASSSFSPFVAFADTPTGFKGMSVWGGVPRD
jgi:hypothetical protein